MESQPNNFHLGREVFRGGGRRGGEWSSVEGQKDGASILEKGSIFWNFTETNTHAFYSSLRHCNAFIATPILMRKEVITVISANDSNASPIGACHHRQTPQNSSHLMPLCRLSLTIAFQIFHSRESPKTAPRSWDATHFAERIFRNYRLLAGEPNTRAWGRMWLGEGWTCMIFFL